MPGKTGRWVSARFRLCRTAEAYAEYENKDGGAAVNPRYIETDDCPVYQPSPPVNAGVLP
jgi:hypothetical protein